MKKKFLSIFMPSALVATVTTGVLCAAFIKPNAYIDPITPEQRKIFNIEGETLKGFNSNVSIEEMSKYCENQTLKLPACKNIDDGAFESVNPQEYTNDSPFYTKIVISNATTSIGSRAFYGNTASSIGWENESGSSSASSLLTTIGSEAFAFCSNLTSFQLPPKLFVTGGTIGNAAFEGCTNLSLFDCTNYTVSSAPVTTGWAFGCFAGTKLTGNVKFNSTASTVPLNCSKLWSRFAYCGMKPAWNQVNSSGTTWSSQKKLVPDEYYVVSSGVLKKSRKIWYNDSEFNYAILPSTISSIDITTSGTENIFKTKTKIKEWDLSSTTMTAIPANLLSDLSDTSISIKLNSSTKTIGANAFKNNKWTLTIPHTNVTTVGANAFDGSNLTSWTFKTTMTSIGNSAFANCSKLTSLDFTAYTTAPTSGWGTGVFSSTGGSSTNTVTIKTNSNRVNQWRIKESMKPFFVNQGLTFDGTPSIKWTLSPNGKLTYENLFDISSGVLNGWAKDSSSKIMTETELNTVLGRLGKTQLTFPASVTSIADNAFYNTSTSKSTIPSCITSISFKGSNVTTVGKAAFKSLPSTVTSVTLGGTSSAANAKLVTIGEEAFYQMQGVTSLDLKYATKLTTISKKAFWGMKGKITNLEFTGDSVLKTIGEDAFSGSENLTGTLTLLNTMTSIGEAAFYGCNFTALTIPAFTNAISIGNMVFGDNNNLATITMTAYSAAPTNWTVTGSDMLSGIKSSGTVKVGATGTILTYLKKYSYEMKFGGWTEST